MNDNQVNTSANANTSASAAGVALSCKRCGQAGLCNNDAQECIQCTAIHRLCVMTAVAEKDRETIKLVIMSNGKHTESHTKRIEDLENALLAMQDTLAVVLNIDPNVEGGRLAKVEKDVEEIKNNDCARGEAWCRRMHKLEEHNIKIVTGLNECVASINLFGKVCQEIQPWREDMVAAIIGLRRRVKQRVKKVKFEGWKIKVKHHRQHLIRLTA